jgi:hypothetical protein
MDDDGSNGLFDVRGAMLGSDNGKSEAGKVPLTGAPPIDPTLEEGSLLMQLTA